MPGDKQKIAETVLEGINNEGTIEGAIVLFVIGGIGIWYAAKNFFGL